MLHFPSKIVSEDINEIISTDLQWERFRNKRVLISGANGFLPSYLIFTLVALNNAFDYNIKIVALVRNKVKADLKFDFLKNQKPEFIVQDVSLPVRSNDKIDFVIHAASQASPKYYGVDPVGTLNTNTLGTNNLLVLSKEHSVERFLYFSSSEVYGSVEEKHIPTSERNFGSLDPSVVRSCYAESKRMGETMCVSWSHQYKISTSIVRPFHTYGPGMDLTDGRVYADFVNDILKNKNIEMQSDGLAKRAFCYLSDATTGFFSVLLKGENAEAYNIGNPDQETSIINLAEKLINLFPEKKLKVIRLENVKTDYLKSTISRNCPDITKAKMLGWKPNTSIEKGFKRTIESYL